MREPFFRLALALGTAILLLTQTATLRAHGNQEEAFYFHSPVPLGVDSIRLLPAHKTVYLLGSVENQTLDGLHVMRAPHHGHVLRVDGSEVTDYPSALDFRVTASAMERDFQGVDDPYKITSNKPLNEFLLGLKFKLKIFRGLKMHEVNPSNVKIIGVPAYEPYPERVYRVSFDTPHVPVDARMVLEVYGPDGQMLTRFHLEML